MSHTYMTYMKFMKLTLLEPKMSPFEGGWEDDFLFSKVGYVRSL